jgi:hypothetical protein
MINKAILVIQVALKELIPIQQNIFVKLATLVKLVKMLLTFVYHVIVVII